MPSTRLLFAPWWVRLLAVAVPLALVIVVLYLVVFPNVVVDLGWLWTSVGAAALSLTIAGLRLSLHAPARQAVLETVADLDPDRQRQAVRALYTGPIPDDPTVVDAALRWDAVAKGYRRRTPRWMRASRWWATGLLIVPAILYFATRMPKPGWLMVAFVLATGAALVRDRMLSRRRTSRLPQLRAAAGAPDEVAGAEAAGNPDAAGSPSPGGTATGAGVLRGRSWLILAAVLVLTAVAIAPVYLLPRPRDCRTVIELQSYLYEHRQLLDPAQIEPGGPDIGEYRAFVRELQSYRDRVSRNDISAHVYDIGVLAEQALATVVEARSATGESADDMQVLQQEYEEIGNQIVDTERSLLTSCHID